MNEREYFEQFSGNPMGESELRKAYEDYCERPFAGWEFVQLQPTTTDGSMEIARLSSDKQVAYRLSDGAKIINPIYYKVEWELYRFLNIRNGYIVGEWEQTLDDH